MGGGGGIFYENFYHKILLREGGDVGRGIWRGDFGCNWGYFIKMGVEIFLNWGCNWRARKRKYGLQLACKEEEIWAAIGVKGRGNIVFSSIFHRNNFQ